MQRGSRLASVVGIIGGAVLFTFVSPSDAQEERPIAPRYVVVSAGELGDPESYPLVLTRDLDSDARAPVGGVIEWLGLRGQPLEPGARPSPGGIRLRARAVGSETLALETGPHRVEAIQLGAFSSSGEQAGRAALARSIPSELVFGALPQEPEESRRFVVAASRDALPTMVTVVSLNAGGTYADSVRDIPFSSTPCPADWGIDPSGGVACGTTPPIRLATDVADRRHPAVMHRTLLGEVGGSVALRLEGGEVFRIPILAPKELEGDGPGRYRVKMRAVVLRTFPGGPPALGADAEEARAIVREEVASTSRMWGQCGVHLGPDEELSVEVVDPPELTMLTVGCGRGLPATGGTIRFSAQGRKIFLRTHEGESPRSVAPRLASLLRKAGLQVKVLRNNRSGESALSSFDLVLSDGSGNAVELVSDGGRLTDDPSLGVCQAELSLADGLEHFHDFNAAAGTMEERYLLRALSDDDPSTVELIVVPLFSGLGRIGESFIHSPGGSMESALILDRTGVRAGARSFTLAHELGHILLDLPGHPDDFGVDTPSSLMDADAADSTIFGPRRLSLEDCRRALRQSGRDAPVPLIIDFPLNSTKGQ